MDSIKKNELATVDQINQVAFRHFLEKGYEATNLRKISDEVGIKTASLYFYYKSKSDLFFHILNGICDRQVNMIQHIKDLNFALKPEDQLYIIFRDTIYDCIKNSVEYKFRLRYRMFPAEELASDIRKIYDEWQEKEFNIYKPMFKECLTVRKLVGEKREQFVFYEYRRLLYGIIYEILIFGMSIKEDAINVQWKQFLISALNSVNDSEN